MRRLVSLGLGLSGLILAPTMACSSDGDADVATATGGTAPVPFSTGGLFVGLVPGATTGGQGTGGLGMGGQGTGGDGEDQCPTVPAFVSEEAAGLTIGEGAYTYVDPGGSCIAISGKAGQICVEGTAAQVVDNMWETIFGAGFGLQLTSAGEAFDASEYTGLAFTITDVPPGLRAGLMMQGDGNLFFSSAFAPGDNVLVFDDLENGSWVTEPGTLDLSVLTDVQWHIGSTDAQAIDFEFCVSDIRLVTQSGMGGASNSN